MKTTGRIFVAATLAGAIASFWLTPGAFAQSAQSQTADPSQYSGVSHPPDDATIQADEDAQPSRPKPSAAVPVAPPAAAVNVAPAPAPVATASLQKRGWSPDDDIVTVVPTNPNELNAGTNIRVRLAEDISTRETRPGSPFRATIDRDVYNEGRVIIPAGAEMRGRVVEVSEGHHLGPHATLRLRPESVVLPDGTAYRVYAQAVRSEAPGTHTDDEGGIEASSHYKKDAVEYGAGIGAGAVVGGEVAGPVGAGVGTLVGAGAVSAHMLLQQPQAAELPQGSILIFSLTEPMALTPAKN